MPLVAASTSAIAISGAMPVPPPRQSTSLLDPVSAVMAPSARPSSTVSPGRVWYTRALLTSPAGTARTCSVSVPSGRGALASQ
ncbi:MAG TPA: hypothetical protein VMG38_14105 [Trebonia sp.]|nr:hypothetical protein [Trebonia sp.]